MVLAFIMLALLAVGTFTLHLTETRAHDRRVAAALPDAAQVTRAIREVARGGW